MQRSESSVGKLTGAGLQPVGRAKPGGLAQRQPRGELLDSLEWAFGSLCLRRQLTRRYTYFASRHFFFAADGMSAGNLKVVLPAVAAPGVSGFETCWSKSTWLGRSPAGVNLHSRTGVNLLWSRFPHAGPILISPFYLFLLLTKYPHGGPIPIAFAEGTKFTVGFGVNLLLRECARTSPHTGPILRCWVASSPW